MSTIGSMIDTIRGELQSWALDEEQSTTLAADMGSADTTFTVNPARGVVLGISPGMVEIGQELMYVSDVDNAGTITVPAWGRGYQSTTKAAHTAGSRVVSQPTFPRSKILDEINDALERVFPDLFAVKQIETVTTLPQITYALTADAQRPLAAWWLLPDGRLYWKGIRHMRMRPGGGVGPNDVLPSVDIGDAMMPGRPIRILYSAKPSPIASESDDFATVTGLPASCQDVVELAVQTALVRSQETSRLQMSSVEQQNRAQLVAPSAALTTSRFLENQYQTRLMEERSALQRLYPPRVMWDWI